MNNKFAEKGSLKIIAAGGAFAAAYSLKNIFTLQDTLSYTNSFASLIICIAFYFLIHSALVKACRRELVSGLIFAFIVSFGLFLGRFVYTYDNPVYSFGNIAQMIFSSLCLAPAVTSVFIHICHFYIDLSAKTTSTHKTTELIIGAFKKHTFPKLTLLFFLCFIPCFLVFFPGIYAYDISTQLGEISQGSYTTFHPLLHTLFLKGTFSLGKLLFGSYTAGSALCTLLQMLILSACFAYTISSVFRRYDIPSWVKITITAAVALNPLNHMLSISSTKDVIFAAVFMVTVCLTTELIFDVSAFFADKKKTALYIIITVLMLLFRKNAVIAYIPFIILSLFTIKKCGVKLTALFLCCLIMFFGADVILKKALNAEDGPAKEAYSVPVMQLARAYVYSPDAFTPQDIELIGEIYQYDVRQMYSPYNADMVKLVFNQQGFDENRSEYLSLYFDKLKSCTSDYVTAFLKVSLGNWYSDDIMHSDNYACLTYLYGEEQVSHLKYLTTPYITSETSPYIYPLLPSLNKWYVNFAGGGIHQNIPVISMLFSPGFSAVVMFFFIALSLCRKKYALLLPLALPCFYWVTLLMGPCVLVRYMYPIICCNLIFTLCFFGEKKTSDKLYYK